MSLFVRTMGVLLGLLGVTGFGFLIPAAPAGGNGKPTLRVRKDIVTLNANSPEVKSYKKAVAEMKKLPAADKRSWEFQTKIHGWLNEFNECEHGSWNFLPWHRAYLFYFEEICRELSKDESFALPYWDWSANPQVPDLFWGQDNPLNDRRSNNPPPFGRFVGQGEQVPSRDFDEFLDPTKVIKRRLLDNPDFITFGGGQNAGGELEGTPHNFVHRWVGMGANGLGDGDMVRGGSPLDPIFWLHHCNIDRLWTEWALRHPNNTPSDQTWLKTSFRFYDRKADPASKKVEETLDTGKLFYRYDRRGDIVVARTTKPPKTLAAAVATSSPLDNALDFDVPLTPELRTLTTQCALGGPYQERPTARILVEGVKVPENLNVSLRVFLKDSKGVTRETPITDPRYIGSHTFFLGKSGQAHAKKGKADLQPKDNGHGKDGHRSVSFYLNVSPALRQVYGERSLPADQKALGVTIVPVPLFPGGKNVWQGSIQDVRPAGVRYEVVGRQP